MKQFLVISITVHQNKINRGRVPVNSFSVDECHSSTEFEFVNEG